MRDGDIREALQSALDNEHAEDPDTRFVPELDLCGTVRVDLAVLNGYLAGYEIKSERDTLRRLPRQVAVYGRVLDFASLVVADRHLEHAMAHLPEWWGVRVASRLGDAVRVEQRRPPSLNGNVDATALVQLLWREEALGQLTALGLDGGLRSKPRRQLWQRLCEVLALDDLRSCVRERLKARTSWRLAQSQQ